jgi:hypothetical protein
MILNQFSLSNFELVTFCLKYYQFSLISETQYVFHLVKLSNQFLLISKQSNLIGLNITNKTFLIYYQKLFMTSFYQATVHLKSVLNNFSFIRFPVKKIKVSKTSHKVFLLDLSLPVLPYFNINHIHVRL